MIDGLAINSSVICLAETWLAVDRDTDCYQLPGYQKMMACNRKTKGRSLSIFVKNNIRWDLICQLIKVHCQELTVRFKLNDVNVLVTTTNVKPNTSIKNFSENMQDYLDNIQLRPKDCLFLCGDLNLIRANPITENQL